MQINFRIVYVTFVRPSVMIMIFQRKRSKITIQKAYGRKRINPCRKLTLKEFRHRRAPLPMLCALHYSCALKYSSYTVICDDDLFLQREWWWNFVSDQKAACRIFLSIKSRDEDMYIYIYISEITINTCIYMTCLWHAYIWNASIYER